MTNQEILKEYSQKFLKQSEKTAEEFTGFPFQIENLSFEKYLSTDKEYNCFMRMKNHEVELILQVSADKENIERYRELIFQKFGIHETENRRKKADYLNQTIILEFCNHYVKVSDEYFESLNLNEEKNWYLFIDYEEKVEKELLLFNLTNKEYEINLEVRYMFYPINQKN